ncbi:hypothetical protein D3C77_766590 [compost metagenome]
MQLAELGIEVLQVALANKAEPAVQQCDSFVDRGVGSELQVDVPEHLPGESIQRFGFDSPQPAALAKRVQPSARAAVA